MQARPGGRRMEGAGELVRSDPIGAGLGWPWRDRARWGCNSRLVLFFFFPPYLFITSTHKCPYVATGEKTDASL